MIGTRDFVTETVQSSPIRQRVAAAWRVLRGKPTLFWVSAEVWNGEWDVGGDFVWYVGQEPAFLTGSDGGPPRFIVRGSRRGVTP
jgi:hypothetical protein